MFVDQLDERNAMVKCVLAFEQVGQVGLADSGWFSTRKVVFLVHAPNVMIRVCSIAILMIET
jgi:hypothetical protein